MNKLALALALSAVGATAGSAQIINLNTGLNTGASIVTDRIQDGTWRREGNTDIYVRTRIDANGNRVVERARRDALGNYVIIDSRIINRDRDGNRGRTDNTWKRSSNENRVYVRTRVDANGNRIMEKARRDANGNYVIFDTKVLGQKKIKDSDNDGRDDRWEKGKAKDGKWKKDKDGKKWDKAVNKSEGKHGKNEKDRNNNDNDNDNDENDDDGNR